MERESTGQDYCAAIMSPLSLGLSHPDTNPYLLISTDRAVIL